MVTAFWRLTISATAGAPPNSPSRVQGSSWPQATRRRLVRKLDTSPPSSGDMVSSALITAWSWRGFWGWRTSTTSKSPSSRRTGSAGMPLKPPTDTVLLTMP